MTVEQPDSRRPSAVGRVARMELAFEARGGRTIIAHSYAEPPYSIRAFDLNGAAYVIVVCSGPGVFGGDALHQSIQVDPGARVVMTSQAALQVHPSGGLPATIRHEYRVANDAELHCHWDAVIPFAAASLTQRFDIDLDTTASLYWSDALMAGRLSRGESWRFECLAHELRLRSEGRCRYLERFRIAPADRVLASPWRGADDGYFATVIVRHGRVRPDVAEALHRCLAETGGTRLAVDVLEPGLLLARIAATDGARFAALRNAIRGTAAESIFETPAVPVRK